MLSNTKLHVMIDHKYLSFVQLTIPGFEYTAKGFAQNKKDAETEAAKDFCGYLIGAGLVPPESLPDSVFAEEMNTPVPPLPAAGAPAPVQQQRRPPQIQQQPVGQPSQGLNQQSNFGGPSSLMNGMLRSYPNVEGSPPTEMVWHLPPL